MSTSDQKYSDRLLKADRYRWHNPEPVLDALGLTPGMTLADVGSGPGFYTLPAAQRVDSTGRVYAVDIDAEALEHLSERARSEGLANIEVLIAERDRLPLTSSSVDTALVANVLHEVPDWAALLDETDRILRPQGVLAVIEWRKEQTEKGPPLARRLACEDIESHLRAAGYGEFEPFEAGLHLYGIRAAKGKGSPADRE